jgi:outer membrane protein TolC
VINVRLGVDWLDEPHQDKKLHRNALEATSHQAKRCSKRSETSRTVWSATSNRNSSGIKLQDQTATYAEAARLANVRFLGGYTSFLEVLVTQQQYFSSELSLAQAWNAELQNYVQLYTALGGEWALKPLDWRYCI